MQSQFFIYLQLGFQHITNINALDHILFVIGICVAYSLRDWTKVAFLVSAFTVGHFISLMLTLFSPEPIIPSSFIEILIPITILLVAYSNIFINERRSNFSMRSKYWISGLFGIIHGLGFSNYLRSILMDDELGLSLFSFNLGVEMGQLCIVLVVLLIGYLVVIRYGISQKRWRQNISILIFIFATNLLIQAIRNA